MTKRLICRVGIILLVVVGIGALMLASRILFAQDPSDTLPAPLLEASSTTLSSSSMTAPKTDTTTAEAAAVPAPVARELPLLTVHRLPVFQKPAPRVEIPSVIPLAWSAEPIPVKVIFAGYGLAVADFTEGVLKTYRYGDHHLPGGSVVGASITARGDAIVVTLGGSTDYVSFLPNADFGKQPIPLQHSRIGSVMAVSADRIASLVWILQRDHQDMDGRPKVSDTWIDLVSIDTGKAVMTADLKGDYGMVGIVDSGLLLKEDEDYGDGRVVVLGRDGTLRNIVVDPGRIVAAHGQHVALIGADKELVVTDIETNYAQHIAKPGPGAWIDTMIPYVPESTFTRTPADEFVIGFRTTTGEWSLHAVSLADQSAREISTYSEYNGTEPLQPYKPLFWATKVADGEMVLAFTLEPNDWLNVINDTGNLVPVVPLHGYRVLDAVWVTP